MVAAAEPAPTRWRAEGITVALPAERRVSRVAFELSDDEWLARPRVEGSRDGVEWFAIDARASLADAALSLYRDPRHARGELRFAPASVRFLRVDPRLPARRGAIQLGS